MSLARYPDMTRKSRALPPPVFPLLVSAVVSHNKPKEMPCATKRDPEPEPNSNQVEEPTDKAALQAYTAEVAPLYPASTDYAKVFKVRQRLSCMKYTHRPIEVVAAGINADPRLTSVRGIRRVGGM
jgi:hypothetical protein